ncbi:MAG: phasin family protein [Bradyrhizobiaceae bacterium]|nr:phasin family protein [Bradyrhizobiaceae bacterium]
MDLGKTVDCDDKSDEEVDDSDPRPAGSETAESSDGTLAAAAAGTTEYSLRIMEASCINTNAMVAFAGALLRAKSLSEMVVITTAHARRQIEAVADQTKQLAAAAHKMAPKKSTTVEPD